MTTTPLPRLWRTARHLQFSQIAWRVRRVASRLVEQRLPRRVRQSEVDLQAIDQPNLPPLTRSVDFDVDYLIEELSRGELTLLNQRKSLGGEMIHWPTEFGSRDRLWQVTLHYHKWLYSLAIHANGVGGTAGLQASKLLHRYLRSWLDQCGNPSRPSRSIPWNAYAIATRLEWWARIIGLLSQSNGHEDLALASDLRESAARQAAYLHDHLEWDLRANHLLRDCVGLAMASCLFKGRTAEKWHATAMRIGHEQLSEQVLPDGGHFERSPMYHLEALEDFALLQAVGRTFLSVKKDNDGQECPSHDNDGQECPSHDNDGQECPSYLDTMTEFARWMQHPDGRTPQLNDCTRRIVSKTLDSLGVNTSPHKPQAHATGFRHFADTGIACWHTSQWSIFFDCGPVGPDYQPGHTHADTLTLEASLGGERLLIDPGVGSYDSTPERSHDRSTAAHNTVTIDGLDSSEVWHIFRVGRRAYPTNVIVDHGDDLTSVSASHNGYDHCPGRPRHLRTVALDEQGTLQVIDQIDGDLEHDVTGGWLLEPTWQVEPTDAGWMLRSATQTVEVTLSCNHSLDSTIEPAICHFEFGHTAETRRLTWRYRGPLPLTIETTFIPAPM